MNNYQEQENDSNQEKINENQKFQIFKLDS